MTQVLDGYIARETEAAVAFVQLPLIGVKKPLWIPRKKIVSMIEQDALSVNVELAGESVRRMAFPVKVEVQVEFLKKVGVIQ